MKTKIAISLLLLLSLLFSPPAQASPGRAAFDLGASSSSSEETRREVLSWIGSITNYAKPPFEENGDRVATVSFDPPLRLSNKWVKAEISNAVVSFGEGRKPLLILETRANELYFFEFSKDPTAFMLKSGFED